MSSVYVRDTILVFLESNAITDAVDLTGEFDDLRKMLSSEGIQPDSPWLGLEFIGGEEIPISLVADNTRGLYRETGIIQLHVCAVAKIGAGSYIVQRAEFLRNLFRGMNIGGIIIDKVSLVNTGPGATLEFEAGYVSGTVSLEYHYDFTP